ncbi:hypothetical protein WN943_014686 [Citrus x changshan-huyou]
MSKGKSKVIPKESKDVVVSIEYNNIQSIMHFLLLRAQIDNDQVVLGDLGDLNPYHRASRSLIHVVIDVLGQTIDIRDSLESLNQRERMINCSLAIVYS